MTTSGATDSKYGPSAFSVQNNTNIFPISCHPGWLGKWQQEGINGTTTTSTNATGGPQPGAGGAALPGCTNGDTGWVQFTMQTYDSGKFDAVCVWNIDRTPNPALFYYPQTWTACQNAGKPGFWSTIQVSGSVDTTRHLLAATASLPWSSEWVAVVVPDWLGLCWQPTVQCPWSQTSGTVLGAGKRSQLQFAKGSTVQTIVSASTCGGFSAADQKTQCAPPSLPPFNPYSATIASPNASGESNNLTTYFGYLAPDCRNSTCQQTFTSQN